MAVTQISIGRFHHFHLARQLEKHHLLDSIYTGYPRFKLNDENGIPKDKIKTFPWLQAPYMMMRGRLGLGNWKWLNEEWEWLAQESLDKYVALTIKSSTTVVALSAGGLKAGITAKKHDGYFICDRGSSHIRFQDQILKEEYLRWGCKHNGINPRIINKEQEEYNQADVITVPSEFVRQSFITMGVPEHKLVKIVYGARLERFSKVCDPDIKKFKILWVGEVSLRKGFIYLVKAFNKLKHPNKSLTVVGIVSPEIKDLLHNFNTDGISFCGHISNSDLSTLYSSSHVFVLPSIEDGFGMVMSEALACGCPVIASTNTGAIDLIENGKQGFIIPIRSEDAIAERLQLLMDNPDLRQQMGDEGIKKVKSLGGWDSYGNDYAFLVNSLEKKIRPNI